MNNQTCEFAKQIIRKSNFYRCLYSKPCDGEIYFMGMKYCRNELRKDPRPPESDLELGIGAMDKETIKRILNKR